MDELLVMISHGLKKPLTKNDILVDEIKIGNLKRIDKIFNKGLHFYLDPKSIEISQDASIFFRKTKFGVDLNIGAKKIVNQFEEFKISLSAIAKLAELHIERTLPLYQIHHNPKTVAIQLRKAIYPEFNTDKKEFLKSIIGKFAENNILVFEFVETWNKIEKANIDGFFLNPNVIVLKRQQLSYRREIFTLIHEFGHFLINEEEVEQIDNESYGNIKLSEIEKWCNEFAYFFLIGKYEKIIENLEIANVRNDYHFKTIEFISQNTHLSQIAIFTRLLFQKKISFSDYKIIKADFEQQFLDKQELEKKQREIDKQHGIKPSGRTPKPINSPLLISTIQTAFYEGVINEYDVCKTLNISADKLERYL